MHTNTQLDVLRQGIEIKGVVEDDFGNLVPGPHELWGNVDGVPVVIASVELSGEYSIDGGGEYQLSEEEAIANIRRLAHCWNCHDDLLAALEAFCAEQEKDFPGATGGAYAIARAAIAKARGE